MNNPRLYTSVGSHQNFPARVFRVHLVHVVNAIMTMWEEAVSGSVSADLRLQCHFILARIRMHAVTNLTSYRTMGTRPFQPKTKSDFDARGHIRQPTSLAAVKTWREKVKLYV